MGFRHLFLVCVPAADAVMALGRDGMDGSGFEYSL